MRVKIVVRRVCAPCVCAEPEAFTIGITRRIAWLTARESCFQYWRERLCFQTSKLCSKTASPFHGFLENRFRVWFSKKTYFGAAFFWLSLLFTVFSFFLFRIQWRKRNELALNWNLFPFESDTINYKKKKRENTIQVCIAVMCFFTFQYFSHLKSNEVKPTKKNKHHNTVAP